MTCSIQPAHLFPLIHLSCGWAAHELNVKYEVPSLPVLHLCMSVLAEHITPLQRPMSAQQDDMCRGSMQGSTKPVAHPNASLGLSSACISAKISQATHCLTEGARQMLERSCTVNRRQVIESAYRQREMPMQRGRLSGQVVVRQHKVPFDRSS